MMIRKIVTGCLVLSFSGIAAAQGLFNFDEIPGVDQEPAVAVDINEAMMNIIRGVAQAADPASADVLTGLRSMHLRVYHNGDNSRRFSDFIDDVTVELETAGWARVVYAQDEGSKVRIHMRLTGEEISGMTVMVADGAEAIFINIDGTVSAADLGRVMAALPVGDVLESLSIPRPAGPAPADELPN